jgi:hypothetical protein
MKKEQGIKNKESRTRNNEQKISEERINTHTHSLTIKRRIFAPANNPEKGLIWIRQQV